MKRLTVLAILLLIALVLGGCGKKTTPEEEVLLPVEITKAQVADLAHTLNTSGEIMPGAEAAVAPKVSGRVTAVHVKVGDRVSKGQVLFELDATEALNAKTLSEAGVGVARAGLHKAEQEVTDAQLNYDRIKALYEAQTVSKTQFEQAESKLNNALIGKQLAEEQLIQSQATYQNALENCNNFTVASPLTGLIASVSIENGEMAGPQATALTIVQLDTVKVKVPLSENVVVSIKPGVEVPVIINSLNKTVTGTVVSVAPQADSSTRAFPVEIQVNNDQGDLKAGMVAQLDLETGISKGAITLPVDAVLERNGQFYVYAVEDGKAKEITVKKGVSTGDLVEITEGIQEGQEIIVKGNHLVTDGQAVEVVNSERG
ncbi:Macrolide export protein MacA [Pelotomaculum schinkii]|uniref:Macrolide export protein MacA n=1 Tax=Pelotomaculum schinkii TaxID=78350 RepID=A0A4Y7RBK0_9FIRM|nr:efflux RND transporter periplasmic adaptor subunit [Pelotomaculum schinkii]TEB06090.1 Macrolide export protein MacA [Pelotomaculum schinkii]